MVTAAGCSVGSAKSKAVSQRPQRGPSRFKRFRMITDRLWRSNPSEATHCRRLDLLRPAPLRAAALPFRRLRDERPKTLLRCRDRSPHEDAAKVLGGGAFFGRWFESRAMVL